MKKYSKIGNRLRQLRAHLTQSEFAEKIKVPLRTYKYYESGERMPKGDVIYRIASICDVSADLILGGEIKKLSLEQEEEAIEQRLWIEGAEKGVDYTEKDFKQLAQKEPPYIIGIKRPAEEPKEKKVGQVSGPVIEYGYEPSREDLLAKAEEVLSTRTIYRIALASNIEAFYEAISFREDNRRQKAKIEGLETRLAALEKKLSQFSTPGAATEGEGK